MAAATRRTRWSETEHAYLLSAPWAFYFGDSGISGAQFSYDDVTDFNAWAVRAGDIVSIPERNTSLLLGIGMMGLGMRRSSVHHYHSL